MTRRLAATRRLVASGSFTAIALWALLPMPARAQSVPSTNAAPFGAVLGDEHVFSHLLLNELEGRLGPTNALRWDGEGWIGTDSNRLWVKSEGRAGRGGAEDGDQELLYDRPVSPYFDLQGGLRYDLDSRPGRGWVALGVEGLAPYLFELSATFYASDAEHFAAKLQASYDELLTQRLIAQPLIEINAYTRADPARHVGSGFSDIDAGLRVRYEISRKFAPYLGVTYHRTTGPAAQAGWRLAAGLRAWL